VKNKNAANLFIKGTSALPISTTDRDILPLSEEMPKKVRRERKRRSGQWAVDRKEEEPGH
jgi:hypothetical protein